MLSTSPLLPGAAHTQHGFGFNLCGYDAPTQLSGGHLTTCVAPNAQLRRQQHEPQEEAAACQHAVWAQELRYDCCDPDVHARLLR